MEKINKEIVLLLINGSHSAFSKIYVKCHRQFFLLALRYLKSKEMAEDAVQYSFMRLWETRTQIDVEQGVEPYLYGILKNHLLNTYKFHQLTLEKKKKKSYWECHFLKRRISHKPCTGSNGMKLYGKPWPYCRHKSAAFAK